MLRLVTWACKLKRRAQERYKCMKCGVPVKFSYSHCQMCRCISDLKTKESWRS